MLLSNYQSIAGRVDEVESPILCKIIDLGDPRQTFGRDLVIGFFRFPQNSLYTASTSGTFT